VGIATVWRKEMRRVTRKKVSSGKIMLFDKPGSSGWNNSGREDTEMACRDRDTKEKIDSFDYCILEVLLKKRDGAGIGDQLRLMTIDNHFETLRFVHENLDACIGNIVKLQRMQDNTALSSVLR
jgi:hypothetical protein